MSSKSDMKSSDRAGSGRGRRRGPLRAAPTQVMMTTPGELREATWYQPKGKRDGYWREGQLLLRANYKEAVKQIVRAAFNDLLPPHLVLEMVRQAVALWVRRDYGTMLIVGGEAPAVRINSAEMNMEETILPTTLCEGKTYHSFQPKAPTMDTLNLVWNESGGHSAEEWINYFKPEADPTSAAVEITLSESHLDNITSQVMTLAEEHVKASDKANSRTNSNVFRRWLGVSTSAMDRWPLIPPTVATIPPDNAPLQQLQELYHRLGLPLPTWVAADEKATEVTKVPDLEDNFSLMVDFVIDNKEGACTLMRAGQPRMGGFFLQMCVKAYDSMEKLFSTMSVRASRVESVLRGLGHNSRSTRKVSEEDADPRADKSKQEGDTPFHLFTYQSPSSNKGWKSEELVIVGKILALFRSRGFALTEKNPNKETPLEALRFRAEIPEEEKRKTVADFRQMMKDAVTVETVKKLFLKEHRGKTVFDIPPNSVFMLAEKDPALVTEFMTTQLPLFRQEKFLMVTPKMASVEPRKDLQSESKVKRKLFSPYSTKVLELFISHLRYLNHFLTLRIPALADHEQSVRKFLSLQLGVKVQRLPAWVGPLARGSHGWFRGVVQKGYTPTAEGLTIEMSTFLRKHLGDVLPTWVKPLVDHIIHYLDAFAGIPNYPELVAKFKEGANSFLEGEKKETEAAKWVEELPTTVENWLTRHGHTDCLTPVVRGFTSPQLLQLVRKEVKDTVFPIPERVRKELLEHLRSEWEMVREADLASHSYRTLLAYSLEWAKLAPPSGVNWLDQQLAHTADDDVTVKMVQVQCNTLFRLVYLTREFASTGPDGKTVIPEALLPVKERALTALQSLIISAYKKGWKVHQQSTVFRALAPRMSLDVPEEPESEPEPEPEAESAAAEESKTVSSQDMITDLTRMVGRLDSRESLPNILPLATGKKVEEGHRNWWSDWMEDFTHTLEQLPNQEHATTVWERVIPTTMALNQKGVGVWVATQITPLLLRWSDKDAATTFLTWARLEEDGFRNVDPADYDMKEEAEKVLDFLVHQIVDPDQSWESWCAVTAPTAEVEDDKVASPVEVSSPAMNEFPGETVGAVAPLPPMSSLVGPPPLPPQAAGFPHGPPPMAPQFYPPPPRGYGYHPRPPMAYPQRPPVWCPKWVGSGKSRTVVFEDTANGGMVVASLKKVTLKGGKSFEAWCTTTGLMVPKDEMPPPPETATPAAKTAPKATAPKATTPKAPTPPKATVAKESTPAINPPASQSPPKVAGKKGSRKSSKKGGSGRSRGRGRGRR